LEPLSLGKEMFIQEWPWTLSRGAIDLFLSSEIQNESKKIKIIDTIRDVPLQKWNHIVINYTDGICDVFINGELHNTKKNIVPYNDSNTIQIGSQQGIHGEICNVSLFYEQFNNKKIQQLYTQFKDKTPPTF
jgi:hypothetical protein